MKIEPADENLRRYKSNCLRHVTRMDNRMPKIVLKYRPNGRKRLGRPLKRLLDVRGKPVGERPLGRPRRRWEDNIKMDLREVGGGGGDWMELAQDRDRWRALVGTVRNLRVPKMQGIS